MRTIMTYAQEVEERKTEQDGEGRQRSEMELKCFTGPLDTTERS